LAKINAYAKVNLTYYPTIRKSLFLITSKRAKEFDKFSQAVCNFKRNGKDKQDLLCKTIDMW